MPRMQVHSVKRHRVPSAHRQQLLSAIVAVLQSPPTSTTGRDLQIRASLVAKAECLRSGLGRSNLRVAEHDAFGGNCELAMSQLPQSYPNWQSDSRRRHETTRARKNLQMIESQGGFWTSLDVFGRHEIFKWWSRGESNPRPQTFTGQFYMRSALIWFSLHRRAGTRCGRSQSPKSRFEPSDPIQSQPM
jgi:hypothetical protein